MSFVILLIIELLGTAIDIYMPLEIAVLVLQTHQIMSWSFIDL